MATMQLPTQNGQTLTIVNDGKTVTLRIAKDGHNRGIAKISTIQAKALSLFLTTEES